MLDRANQLSIAASVTPTALREYAKSRKWEPVEGIRQRIWLFRHPEQKLRQLVIPMDRDDGYGEAVLEAALRIADMEKRPVSAVLDDLATADSDVVRFRVISSEASSGMLPVEAAEGLLEGAKRALLAAASSVGNPVPHHPRMSRMEAQEFLQHCRFGQTEMGSFVIKIACPLAAACELPLGMEQKPFTRKVTTLLLSAIRSLVDGIERDRIDELLEEDGMRPRITSNLCDALIRMHATQEEADLAIAINWAASSHVPPPDMPGSATIKSEYFPALQTIREHLVPSRSAETWFMGTVETLNGDIGPDGRRFGEVTLSLLLANGEEVRAKCRLSADDYATALRVHESSDGWIFGKGWLRRGARIFWLEKVTWFECLTSRIMTSLLASGKPSSDVGHRVTETCLE